MFYEDSQSDVTASLRKLAEFLDQPLKDEDLPELLSYLSVDNVRNNAAVNLKMKDDSFVRRGKSGGNSEMTPEISAKIDAWTAESLDGIDLKFPHF